MRPRDWGRPGEDPADERANEPWDGGADDTDPHGLPQQPDAFEDDEWTEEDERRYQARRLLERRRVRRRRRQAAAFTVIVLLVLGIGVTATGVYQGRWSWPLIGDSGGDAAPAQPCPTPTSIAAQPAEVTAAVLNATDRRGLAGQVAKALQDRGFVVREIGNETSGVPVPEAAQVRHGPEGLRSAQAVAAHVRGAVLVDDGRPDQVVDVVLGAAYTDLLPPQEAAALLTPPAPSPTGCVPASTPATSPPATPAATTSPPSPAPTT